MRLTNSNKKIATKNIFLTLVLFTNALPVLAQQVCIPSSIMPTAPTEQYQQKSDGTVIDDRHRLMWKRCLEGKSGDKCEAGKLAMIDWGEALLWLGAHQNNDFAGYKNWRLPNIRELNTLTEMQCRSPAINADVFTNAPITHVWSSSPYTFPTDYSWYVNFNDGSSTYDFRHNKKALWLVRDMDTLANN